MQKASYDPVREGWGHIWTRLVPQGFFV